MGEYPVKLIRMKDKVGLIYNIVTVFFICIFVGFAFFEILKLAINENFLATQTTGGSTHRPNPMKNLPIYGVWLIQLFLTAMGIVSDV